MNKIIYGKYEIAELFTVCKVQKKLSKIDLSKNGIFDAYSSDSNNNGIIGKCNEAEFRVDKNNPIYVIFGDHTRTFNLAKSDFSVLDNVKVLLPRIVDEDILLYIISVWKKNIRNLGYARHWSIAKNVVLNLPVISQKEYYDIEDINVNYIKNIITEIKKNTIIKSKKFALNNIKKMYNTSLVSLDNYKPKCTAMFKVDLLFDIHPTKTIRTMNNDGDTPVISNTSLNNGIIKYVSNQPTEDGGIITFSDTTESQKTVFYQPKAFIGFSHVQGMYPKKSNVWNENCCLYFISVFKKAIGTNFDYATKFNRTIANSIYVELPVINEKGDIDSIDFKYMDNFIQMIKNASLEKIINKKT